MPLLTSLLIKPTTCCCMPTSLLCLELTRPGMLSYKYLLPTNMNSDQLYHCLRSDPCIRPWIGGIYPIDKLPVNIVNKPSLFIVNDDFSSSVGSHWVTVFFPRPCQTGHDKSSCEFVDSLGHHPSFYHKYLTDFIERNSQSLLFNDRRLQGDRSSVCGHYSLYFSYYRCRNVPVESILSKDHFVLDPCLNDLNVYNFTKGHFPMLENG